MKNERSELVRLVKEEVRAQMKRYATTRIREDFINALNDELGPAVHYHYRLVLGAVNKCRDQVKKGQRQKDSFLQEFMNVLIKPIRSKGLDRKKAAEQSLKEIMHKDASRRRMVTLNFQKTYNLKTLTPLPLDAHEEFLTQVREITDQILQP